MVLEDTRNSFAQGANGMPHLFSVTAALPPAYPTPGSVNMVIPAASQNEWDTLISPAGWSFVFAGQTYTKFVVSTNGWVALMPASATYPILPPNPVNQLSNNTTGFPILAPLWDDHASALIRYNVVAGSLWIGWSLKWQAANASSQSLCYLQLNSTNNVITFHYPNVSSYVPVTPSASIGITGVCTGDYYSVNVTSSSTAVKDSSTEYSNLGAGATRPFNCSYVFTPYQPNDNCGNPWAARNLGTITSSCTNIMASVINATPSGAGNCSTGDDNDVWFTFIKPASVSSIKVTTTPSTCQSVPGTSVEVYSACGSAVLGCATGSVSNPAFGEVTVNGLNACVAETLFARVTSDGDVSGKFDICVVSTSPAPGIDCNAPSLICSLPYTQTGLTTAGSGNNYDSLTSACHTTYMNGEDYVFAYTPATNQCISISLTNTGPNPGVFIMDGCPDLPTTNCIGSYESGIPSATINSVTLTAGQTYYIVVDNNSAGGSIPFDISVQSVGTTQTNDLCTSFINLGTVTTGQSCTWSSDFSNECSTPSPLAGYPLPGCGGFLQGSGPNTLSGDVWFRFTSSLNGNILINTRLGSSGPVLNAAMAIYTGTCGALTLIACDANSGAGPNMPGVSITATTGTNYYIRIWSENATNTGTFQICLSANCAQLNDLICNALPVILGTPILGNNMCAGNSSEPPPPACWVNGTINTVWYTAVVPVSGKLNIKGAVVTNTNTQIAAYTFAAGCSSAVSTYTLLGCNDNTTGCPCTTPDYGSELRLTGLTPGSTVYIAVDGNGGITGEFMLTVVDGNLPYPPLYGQDCNAAIDVCNGNLITVNTPSTGIGNICDPNQSLSGCFSCGERSGIWYTFTVNPPLLQFTITPNTFSPVANFDFALWNVTGQANPCTYLQTAAPIRCNNSGPVGAGATGLSSVGGTGFGVPVTITGPTTFILAIRNWNHTPVGYTLDWMGSNIASPANPTLTWTGATNTDFDTPGNWNCFSSFTCAKDVIIPFNAAIPNQPTLSSNQSVHDLTILAGSSLRIMPGVVLSICGDLNVYGTLTTDPGSTIRFTGTEVQMINGGLTSTNAFANLTVDKTGGSVTANGNIDVKENFSTINNSASVFNINGRHLKVGQHFSNFNGTTTFTGIAGSRVEFNGNVNQNFTNQSGAINLNRVIVNKPAGNVYLTGANSSMNIDSFLVMSTGKICGPKSAGSPVVYLKYGNTAAISGYSATGYIDAMLKRKIFFGSIDFPVGDSLVPNQGGQNGYELANITFTSSTVIPDLTAWFNSWAGPSPSGPPNFDVCPASLPIQYNLPLADNGYWSFERTAPQFNGAYTVTLYNTGGTNITGTTWTVASAPILSSPLNPASWTLFGQCTTPSTYAATRRMQFNVPALSATSFNHHYAAAQSSAVLPIELLSFTAEPYEGNIICKWETASETNNSHFDVERSLDGKSFTKIGEVPGYGHGRSTTKLSYSFIDTETCDEIRYYRLRQVDLNHDFSFSDVTATDCRKNNDEINVFPNPANSTVSISFTENQSGHATIALLDYTGRIIFTKNVSVQKGFNLYEFAIDDLSDGNYIFRVRPYPTDSVKPRNIRFNKGK